VRARVFYSYLLVTSNSVNTKSNKVDWLQYLRKS